MYKSERIDLRLAPRDVQILDQKRGNTSRSAFIRWLIQHHDPNKPVNPMVESSLSEPHPEKPDEPPIPAPIVPPVPPDTPVETQAERPHRHRYKKAPVAYTHVRGVPHYRQSCECGATKVGP